MSVVKEYGPAGLLLVLSVAWVAVLTAWPRPGDPVAVVYPPAASAEAALAGVVAAGAETVHGFGGWAGAVVADSSQPSFVGNLYRGGALAVLRVPAGVSCMR